MIVTSDSEVTDSEDDGYKYRSNTTSKKPAIGIEAELFWLKSNKLIKERTDKQRAMENLNSIKAYNASKNSPKNNNKSIINLNFDKNDSVQLSGHTINESFLNQLLFSNS